MDDEVLLDEGALHPLSAAETPTAEFRCCDTSPNFLDVMSCDTGGIVLSYLTPYDRGSVTCTNRSLASRGCDERYYLQQARFALGVPQHHRVASLLSGAPPHGRRRTPLAVDEEMGGGHSARFLLRHIPACLPSAISGSYFPKLKIVALTEDLLSEATANEPCLAVKYVGRVEGDRTVIANHPFPHSYRGRGSARNRLQTLPFVWAPVSSCATSDVEARPVVAPAAAADTFPASAAGLHSSSDSLDDHRRALGASMVAYYEISIHAAQPQSGDAAPSAAASRTDDSDDAPWRQGRQREQQQLRWLFAQPREGCVAIGLASKEFPLRGLMPGWDSLSYAYHGDDGHCFHGSGEGRDFGPTFGSGDTVGCGILYHCATENAPQPRGDNDGDNVALIQQSSSPVSAVGSAQVRLQQQSVSARVRTPDEDARDLLRNHSSPSIFFTLNGRLVGAPFSLDTSRQWYPAVGLDCPNPIKFNFGASPFAYDVRALNRALFLQTLLPNIRIPRAHAADAASRRGKEHQRHQHAQSGDESDSSDAAMMPSHAHRFKLGAAPNFNMGAGGEGGIAVAPPPPSMGLSSADSDTAAPAAAAAAAGNEASMSISEECSNSSSSSSSGAAVDNDERLSDACTPTVLWKPINEIQRIVGLALRNAVLDRRRMAVRMLHKRQHRREKREVEETHRAISTSTSRVIPTYASIMQATSNSPTAIADATRARYARLTELQFPEFRSRQGGGVDVRLRRWMDMYRPEHPQPSSTAASSSSGNLPVPFPFNHMSDLVHGGAGTVPSRATHVVFRRRRRDDDAEEVGVGAPDEVEVGPRQGADAAVEVGSSTGVGARLAHTRSIPAAVQQHQQQQRADTLTDDDDGEDDDDDDDDVGSAEGDDEEGAFEHDFEDDDDDDDFEDEEDDSDSDTDSEEEDTDTGDSDYDADMSPSSNISTDEGLMSLLLPAERRMLLRRRTLALAASNRRSSASDDTTEGDAYAAMLHHHHEHPSSAATSSWPSQASNSASSPSADGASVQVTASSRVGPVIPPPHLATTTTIPTRNDVDDALLLPAESASSIAVDDEVRHAAQPLWHRPVLALPVYSHGDNAATTTAAAAAAASASGHVSVSPSPDHEGAFESTVEGVFEGRKFEGVPSALSPLEPIDGDAAALDAATNGHAFARSSSGGGGGEGAEPFSVARLMLPAHVRLSGGRVTASRR